MTSEEIKAAIERITQLESDATKTSIANAAVGNGGGWITNRDFRSFMLALLEQADPDSHMELPRDADGAPIHVGDVLYEEGDEPFEVYAFKVCEMMPSKTNGWELFGGVDGEGFSAYNPATCHHYYKPTVSEIIDELEGLRGTGDYESVVMRAAELAGMLRELMAYDDEAR